MQNTVSQLEELITLPHSRRGRDFLKRVYAGAKFHSTLFCSVKYGARVEKRFTGGKWLAITPGMGHIIRINIEIGSDCYKMYFSVNKSDQVQH